MHLSTTPEKCHRTSLRNVEFVHVIEIILFSRKSGWLALKTAGYYVVQQLEFETSKSQDNGNRLNLGHDSRLAT